VAPGVAIMRQRADAKLAYITLDQELVTAAALIEDMAKRLDFARRTAAWVGYLTVLAVLVATFGGR
jgi:hypothetical protein